MTGKRRTNFSLVKSKSCVRLMKKTEDLEHVMNDEVTDINEMIKTINKLQVN